MDAAATRRPVDVRQGLTQTLAVLGSRARARSVRAAIEVEPGPAGVRAVA